MAIYGLSNSSYETFWQTHQEMNKYRHGPGESGHAQTEINMSYLHGFDVLLKFQYLILNKTQVESKFQ